MYRLKITKNQMTKLFNLREFAGFPPIAKQVREAVRIWIEDSEKKLGCKIEQAAEVIKRHEKEEKMRQ